MQEMEKSLEYKVSNEKNICLEQCKTNRLNLVENIKEENQELGDNLLKEAIRLKDPKLLKNAYDKFYDLGNTDRFWDLIVPSFKLIIQSNFDRAQEMEHFFYRFIEQEKLIIDPTRFDITRLKEIKSFNPLEKKSFLTIFEPFLHGSNNLNNIKPIRIYVSTRKIYSGAGYVGGKGGLTIPNSEYAIVYGADENSLNNEGAHVMLNRIIKNYQITQDEINQAVKEFNKIYGFELFFREIEEIISDAVSTYSIGNKDDIDRIISIVKGRNRGFSIPKSYYGTIGVASLVLGNPPDEKKREKLRTMYKKLAITFINTLYNIHNKHKST